MSYIDVIIANISCRKTTTATFKYSTSGSAADPNVTYESWLHLLGDAAVFIDIVQIKSPAELLGHGAPEQHGQSNDEVL